MDYTINVAIQVLPAGDKAFAYGVVDRVIEYIAASGLTYKVCPFETVVEGKYEQVVGLLGGIREVCFKAGAEDILINMKWQISHTKNVTISDKMVKYEKS